MEWSEKSEKCNEKQDFSADLFRRTFPPIFGACLSAVRTAKLLRRMSMPNMTGRPGCRSMGRTSLAPFAFPCFVLWVIGVETEGLVDYQGGRGSFPLYSGIFARSYAVSRMLQTTTNTHLQFVLQCASNLYCKTFGAPTL